MERTYVDRRNDAWNVVEKLPKKQRMADQQMSDGTLDGGDDGQRVQNLSLQPEPSSVPKIDEQHLVTGSAYPGVEHPSMVFFPNAQNFMLPNATMVNKSKTVVFGQTVMDKLRSHIDSNASVDSSARVPAPTCHPKTRLEIRKKLTSLLHDVNKLWRMLWLFGAAGTGKSAVGQSFASACDERGELGAAFFFSRPNGRNKYNTVVPTLAYQLATHCLPYHSALIIKIDYDHDMFNKKPAVQLKQLIIEPLLQIRSQITATFLMLLDGVDECGANMGNMYEREEEQLELVKMVAETVRDYPGLPLFWLLCSRPEEHLQIAFADVNTICRREDLAIDAQCREEVEVVLREGFANIAKDRRIIVPGTNKWPSEDEFDIVEQAVAGLHVFGAAILKDIKHSASPVRQLKSLVPFLKHVASAGYPGSIQVMDLFHTRILGDIPKDDLPTTLQIIGTLITMPYSWTLSAQALCNFMHLDPNDFSSALRTVHSIINIPLPENAHKEALRLYHTSLSDFLTDVSRSQNLYIDQQKILVGLIKTSFSWHITHYHHFHRTHACPLIPWEDVRHEHGPLPQADFTWLPSTDGYEAISDAICAYVEVYCFYLFGMLPDQPNPELLSVVQDFDFRYIPDPDPDSADLETCFNWVFKWDPSGFVRTKPENDSDRLLLTTLEALLKEPATPGQFPLNWHTHGLERFCEYIFFGWDSLSLIICYVQLDGNSQFLGLNPEQVADENAINRLETRLQEMDWY